MKPKAGLRAEKIKLKERRWHEVVRRFGQMDNAMYIQKD